MTYVSSVSTHLSTWEWSETDLFWMIWMACKCKCIKCSEWHAKICQLAVHGHHDLAASALLFLGKSIPQCHDLPRFFFALKSFAQRKPHQLNLLEGFTMDFARKNIMVRSWKCEWSMSKSQSNSEQIWTKHNLTSRLLTRGRGVLDSLGPRGAWSLHLLLHSSLHLRQGLGAEHSWGNPELRHLWKAKDLHAQRCSRGLDLMSMSTAYRWGTNYALIMHWLCLSLQFATAVGRREEIVADSHCRTCCRFCTFEAAKTGKNQVWMVTQTSCPSVWKLRKWIRAWRKLLVLGSRCMGSLAKTYMQTAISSTCTFFAKTIKYKKWGKKFCWNNFEICFHSVKSVSLCRKSVGKSSAELPKTRERCDKFAGRIASRAPNPNFRHRKTL